MNNLQKQSRITSLDTFIHKVRGHDIMLDSDLASAYQVSTKGINKAVSRNPERFPEEFSFQLTYSEWTDLRSQTGTSRSEHGGRRSLPRVFTEHGAVMLATVLNSARAIEASKDIVWTFVRLRQAVNSGEYAPIRPREVPVDTDALIALVDRLKLAEDRVDVFRPRMPYGTISKTTGRPRTSLVAAYFRDFKRDMIQQMDDYQMRLFELT